MNNSADLAFVFKKTDNEQKNHIRQILSVGLTSTGGGSRGRGWPICDVSRTRHYGKRHNVEFYSLHYPAVGIVMSHSIEMIAAMSEYGFKSRSPGSSRAQQQPRPIPSPPPVTMATFPERSNNLSISILKKSLKSLKKKDSSLILQIPNSHQAKQLSKLK